MSNQYYAFLEKLRESGKTNMFGAAPYLMVEFGIDEKEAKEILFKWFDYKNGSEKND